MTTTQLSINDICANDRVRMREVLNPEVVEDYSEAMGEGATFPPIVVFQDADGSNWLADGFHRYEASKKRGFVEIDADIRSGSLRDAILYAVGANVTHGLRRTNADKRRAVLALLQDEEWRGWSNRQIADQAAVSFEFVRQMKEEATDNGCQLPAQTLGRDGKKRPSRRDGSSSSTKKRSISIRASTYEKIEALATAREMAIDDLLDELIARVT